jgi:transcription elongation factor Elf1
MITIFKCPHCSAEYELIMTHISFRQRSYANCQVCWKNMYSWDSSKVPRFTRVVPQDHTRAEN